MAEKSTLSERERRTLRVIFRYYAPGSLCDNFHVSKQVMKDVLEKEGIPLRQVSIGANNIYSRYNEYVRKKPDRDEVIRKARVKVAGELDNYASVEYKDISKIAYKCGTSVQLVTEVAMELGKYKDRRKILSTYCGRLSVPGRYGAGAGLRIA